MIHEIYFQLPRTSLVVVFPYIDLDRVEGELSDKKCIAPTGLGTGFMGEAIGSVCNL